MSKVLYLNFYQDAHPGRQRELEKCLKLNIQNPQIDKIVLMVEPSSYQEAEKLLCCDKIFIASTGRRPTYQDFFNTINKHTRDHDINIITNSDIFFDESLRLLDQVDMNNMCVALTRWDVLNMDSANPNVQFHGNQGSQDVWIFQGKIKPIAQCDFHLGKPGCDNRIAYLIEKAGYKLVNPSRDIITYHLHLTGVRNYTHTQKDIIPPPYRFIGINSIEPLLVPQNCKVLQVDKREGKRVLHIALNAGGKRQEALCKALESVGEYREIDWMGIRDRYGVPHLRNHILKVKEEFQPDIIFMQLQTAGIIDAVIADQLRDGNCFVVNWTGDVRQPIPKWYYEIAKHVSITCFSNEQDVFEFKRKGLRAKFLNIGFDETIYNPNGDKPFLFDVVFLGSHYGDNAFPLSRARYEMVQMLREKYGSRFACFGNGWNFPTTMLSEKEEAQLYRSCKIAINFSHFSLERYTSDRLFRIMGSGAFCLSHLYPGIEKDFLIGSELDCFDSPESLIQNINDYLSQDEMRNKIASSGCELVHRAHTWESRIKQLLSIYEHRAINTRILA